MASHQNDSVRAAPLPELLRQSGSLALFLDFDGVLAPIAPTPDEAKVDIGMIARLQSLNSALDGALSIVSGRPITALDQRLAPLLLPVAGDHGNARRGADGRMTVLNAAAAAAAAEVYAQLDDVFAGDERIVVEQKPSAVALHYRLAPDRSGDCAAALEAAVRDIPQLSIIAGKMVVEARALGADKGVAVDGFMAEAPFTGRTPIFIGDDLTDEDGFAAAQGRGGFGIKVGDGQTSAQYRIDASQIPAVFDAIIKSQVWGH